MKRIAETLYPSGAAYFEYLQFFSRLPIFGGSEKLETKQTDLAQIPNLKGSLYAQSTRYRGDRSYWLQLIIECGARDVQHLQIALD